MISKSGNGDGTVTVTGENKKINYTLYIYPLFQEIQNFCKT